MPSCCLIELEVADESVDLVVGEGDSLTIESGEYIPYVLTDLPDYDGAYTADALFSEQVFQTNQKVMRDDFTVRAINYTEAPNASGGKTLTIGG